MTAPLIEARGLKKYFTLPGPLLHPLEHSEVRAVDNVSFRIGARETFGLIGESGCGKSTTAKLLLRLQDPTDGKVLLDGAEVQAAAGKDLRDYRSQIQAVFQDPYSSLNPRMRVGEIIGEPLIAAGGHSRSAIRDRVAELLTLVGIGAASAKLFPHQFSGGQRQRIAIARALAVRPRVLVLDEPVSALDVSVRAQILNLLQDLQDEFELSYLLISHDLEIVTHMCTNIAVMYLGRIVEQGPAETIRNAPLHPYTKALFSAALPARPMPETRRIKLAGEMPSPVAPPSGCAFHPRCAVAMPVCSQQAPVFEDVAPRHAVACHLVTPASTAAAGERIAQSA